MKNPAWPLNRCRQFREWVAFLFVATLIIVVPTPAVSAQDLPDAEVRFETFEAQLQGAATATRRRLLERLRLDLEDEIVGFSGSIYNLSGISLNRSATAFPDWGVSFFSWEYEGLRLKLPTTETNTISLTPGERARSRLSDSSSATLVILKGERLQLYALTSDEELIDDLRSGIEIHVQVFVSGLLDRSLFGFMVGITTPEAELVCPGGHRFPLSTGFRFCPYCGEKLEEESRPKPSADGG